MAEKRVRLTAEDLRCALSKGGSLSHKQFQALGYDGVFKGWKQKLVRSYFSPQKIERFISLRDKHTTPKSKPKKKPTYRKLIPLNIADDTRDGYNTPEWQEKRKTIYRRDGWRCRSCNKKMRKG